jgi:hypothetical protein
LCMPGCRAPASSTTMLSDAFGAILPNNLGIEKRVYESHRFSIPLPYALASMILLEK